MREKINIDTINGIKQYDSLEQMIENNISDEEINEYLIQNRIIMTKKNEKRILTKIIEKDTSLISFAILKNGYGSYCGMEVWLSEENN